VVLGRQGVVRKIPIPLSNSETEAVKKSGKSLFEIIEDAEKNSE